MWHKPCRTFHPWCLCIKTRCLLTILVAEERDTMTSSNGNIFRIAGPFWGSSPVTGEFPSQRPVSRSFDVFFDLRLNKRLSKQWWHWWSERPSRPLWRHSNGYSNTRFEILVAISHIEAHISTWTKPQASQPGSVASHDMAYIIKMKHEVLLQLKSMYENSDPRPSWILQDNHLPGALANLRLDTQCYFNPGTLLLFVRHGGWGERSHALGIA